MQFLFHPTFTQIFFLMHTFPRSCKMHTLFFSMHPHCIKRTLISFNTRSNCSLNKNLPQNIELSTATARIPITNSLPPNDKTMTMIVRWLPSPITRTINYNTSHFPSAHTVCIRRISQKHDPFVFGGRRPTTTRLESQ